MSGSSKKPNPKKAIAVEIAKAELALRTAERIADENNISTEDAFEGLDRSFVKALLGLEEPRDASDD